MLASSVLRPSRRCAVCLSAALVLGLAIAVVGAAHAGSAGRSAGVQRRSDTRPHIARSLAAAKCGKISFGTPTAFTIPSSGGVVCMTTSRLSVGGRLSLKVDSNGCCGSWFANVLDPNGAQVGYCELHCNAGSDFMEPIPVNTAGVYTVQFTGSPGTATLTLYNVPPDWTGTTTPASGSGASVTIPITTPGQNARITLNGTAGHRLSWIHSGSVGNYGTTLYDSSTPPRALASCGWNCGGGSTFLDPPYTLPYTGTYTIIFDPMWNRTGTETITFYDVPADLNIGLTFGANGTASAPIPIGTPGQNARLTFQGSAGQALSWTQTGSVSIYGTDLYDPSGAYITSCGYSCNSGSLNPTRLTGGPSPGTYKIIFNPFYNQIGTETITLHVTPGITTPPQIFGLADVGETLTVGAGTWSPPATSRSYQWLRCDSLGTSCVAIFGSTGLTYVVSSSDLGSTLRVRESATNSYGTTTADSAQTPIVLAPLDQLAYAHRPTIRFDSAELWRPLEIMAFLNESFQYRTPTTHQICDLYNWGGTQPGPCVPMTNATSDMAANNTDHSYINISGDSPGELGSPNDACWSISGGIVQRQDCDSGPASAFYYEPGQDSANYRYLDYWWFLRDNDEAGVGSCDLCQHDEHEGDWEGVTVALDGAANSGAPPIAYVGYAAHDQFNWFTPDVLTGGTRPDVFSAMGTHASYPDACPSDCHQPAGSSIDAEAPHNGLASWGNNDDGACAAVCLRRLGDWWTWWNGRWGGNQGQIDPRWGWSPRSPGLQGRFQCAESGYTGNCTRPPGSRTPLSRRVRRPPSPRLCAGWFGVDVAALACDAKRLRFALRNHLMRKPGRLHLSVRGHRAGDAPGIAQVLGQPLRPGESILVDGHASPDTIFMLDLRLQRRYRASFTLRDLGLRADRRAPVRARILIRSANGRPELRTTGHLIPAVVHLER
jgi:hypothetical protein